MKQSLRAKRMARLHRRHRGQSKLNLVALMDIFTILVFFLLVNSSDVEVLQNDKTIKLPTSIADKKPEEMLVVSVTTQSIVVGGRAIADIPSVLASDTEDIPALVQELRYLADRKPYKNADEAKRGRDVTIMGDSTIPYTVLKRIMTSCAQSEFRNISLAVSQLVQSEAAPGATP
jgi:biopolymer transport protein ExbD